VQASSSPARLLPFEGFIGTQHHIAIAVAGMGFFNTLFLMPAMHPADRVRVDRKGDILVNAPVIPEYAERIAIFTLIGPYTVQHLHMPLPVFAFLDIDQVGGPAIAHAGFHTFYNLFMRQQLGDLGVRIFHITGKDGMFGTQIYTGGFKANINLVGTIVAFSRCMGFRIDIKRIIPTGLHTALTTDTPAWIKIDDAILTCI
jgi:hypothetical protein